jgi:DNA-binding transcriptional LysR family regulator
MPSAYGSAGLGVSRKEWGRNGAYPQDFDWDDLKHLLAVARHGSTLAAGRALDDQSTVQRRLEAAATIRTSSAAAAADRLPVDRVGLALLPHAERVEDAVQRLNQRHPRCRCTSS